MLEMEKTRVSGKTAAQEIGKELAKANDDLVSADLPEETEKKWRNPGFQQMRIDWRSEDRLIMDRVKNLVSTRLLQEFDEAYMLIYEIYDVVREKDVNLQTGEVLLDNQGFPKWKRNISGQFEEDYTKLTLRQKEHFMFALTTRIFLWEQQAADAWGEAMFAKVEWEEKFDSGFTGGRGTDEARTSKGRMDSREEKYFAILLSWYSRKSDALIRSMQLLSQRLKDTMTM